MKTNLGIQENHLQSTAEELNKLLADEFVLYVKTRNYHWNIEGVNFHEMHSFYKAQVEQLDEIIEQVAQRIRMLGKYTEARLVDYLRLTNLLEPPYTRLQNDQLKHLLSSHETLIHILRRLVALFADKYKDIGSSQLISDLLVKHERMAWMVRSYIY